MELLSGKNWLRDWGGSGATELVERVGRKSGVREWCERMVKKSRMR